MSRYPKRKRAEVSYKETSELEDLADDGFIISDDEEDDGGDWHKTKKAKKQKKLTARKPSNNPRKPRKLKQFPFMNLPAELRLQVYRIVVINPRRTVTIESQLMANLLIRRQLGEPNHIPAHLRRDDGPIRNLRLLRTNKLIYQEAASELYRQTFLFRSASALQTFLLLQRPETMSRLQRVEVQVAETDWMCMPGISAQIGQLVGLKKLTIRGFGGKTNRDICRYLVSTNRPAQGWKVNVASWDKLTGIKIARDLYPYLFPLFHKIVHERGVDGLAKLMEFEGSPWGSNNSNGHCSTARTFIPVQNEGDPKAEERRILRATTMSQEIVKLMEQDSF